MLAQTVAVYILPLSHTWDPQRMSNFWSTLLLLDHSPFLFLKTFGFESQVIKLHQHSLRCTCLSPPSPPLIPGRLELTIILSNCTPVIVLDDFFLPVSWTWTSPLQWDHLSVVSPLTPMVIQRTWNPDFEDPSFWHQISFPTLLL